MFQDPYSSLDPRFTIARTVAEPIVIHRRASRRDAIERVDALLRRVGLDPSAALRYPHAFSGGQRQRIAIARALAAEPRVIVADKPTSSLDVSIQAQVLDLLAELRAERGSRSCSFLTIWRSSRRIANRVAVMRSGRIVELGPTKTVLTSAPPPLYPGADLRRAIAGSDAPPAAARRCPKTTRGLAI